MYLFYNKPLVVYINSILVYLSSLSGCKKTMLVHSVTESSPSFEYTGQLGPFCVVLQLPPAA